ncbi:hypothetical protein B0H67DRAFT_597883 [Lasiosphaeris hirsuta]|uniref:Methyltransferase n=1 Tax=Lasiosphaeris hirsuta TaxID=260670 RepID=A0AA40BDN5_9PEZI|nr:hypothetical protein B0H67DRAFT_597883 [Lasiosphaeris hirsuta]
MDETARFAYLRPLPLYEEETPYHNFIDSRTNIVVERPQLQSVLDIRGKTKDFTLDTCGFEFRQHPLPAINWQNEDEIKEEYIGDLKSLVHDMFPERVERCEMFDFRLRSVGALQKNVPLHPGLCGTYKMPPAMTVHIDQSPLGVLEWLKRETGEVEANTIVNKHRVRVLNIWRPLVDVVEDYPLAMCDPRTVRPSDLVHSAHVSSDYVRRNYLVKYSERFQFYYLSKMTKNEVCAFVVFDSQAVGKDFVRTPPHSAFRHTELPKSDTRPRESIEVRLLVLTPLE